MFEVVLGVLDNPHLVTISGVESGKLEVVHCARDGALANLGSVRGKDTSESHLVAIDMQNRDESTTLCRVEVLVAMPGLSVS